MSSKQRTNHDSRCILHFRSLRSQLEALINILRKDAGGLGKPEHLGHFRALQAHLCSCGCSGDAPSTASPASILSAPGSVAELQVALASSPDPARELLARLGAPQPLPTYAGPPGPPSPPPAPLLSRRFASFPAEHIGLVIGVSGRNVKRVLAASGAKRVTFERNAQDPWSVTFSCTVYGPTDQSIAAAYLQLKQLHRGFVEEHQRFVEEAARRRRERARQREREFQAQRGCAPSNLLPGYWAWELEKLSSVQVERRTAGALSRQRRSARLQSRQHAPARRPAHRGAHNRGGGRRRHKSASSSHQQRVHHQRAELLRYATVEAHEGLELARLHL